MSCGPKRHAENSLETPELRQLFDQAWAPSVQFQASVPEKGKWKVERGRGARLRGSCVYAGGN